MWVSIKKSSEDESSVRYIGTDAAGNCFVFDVAKLTLNVSKVSGDEGNRGFHATRYKISRTVAAGSFPDTFMYASG